MDYPFVSVIIPNYNHAAYLDERIQSVLKQTYQNFELIILDDCSPDNGASRDVIEKYRDNPHVCHIIYNEANSGFTFKQWHKGMELAKGELIWIAESDDACDKTLLETLVKGYIENNAVMSFCKSCRYDRFGNKSNYNLQNSLTTDIVLQGKAFISKFMLKRNVVANASSVIFNRKMAINVERQYMTMRGEGDYLFWLELMEKGNVFFCNKELNYFRCHESNTTKNLTYKGISPIEHKFVYDYLVKHRYFSYVGAWKEKMRCLRYFYEEEYESRSVRKKVLNAWDKSRVGRIYILYRKIKDVFF